MILMPEVNALAHLFAPWASLYGDSAAVATTVTALHLVAMLFGGGMAVAADRATLRARPEDPAAARRMLAELGALHAWVVAALVVLAISGTAMAAADVKTFASSPVFAAKLGVVVALLINGLALQRTERALERLAADAPGAGADPEVTGRHARLWRRLRGTAWISAALWTLAVITGVMLTNAA